jgi:hypothetical protein
MVFGASVLPGSTAPPVMRVLERKGNAVPEERGDGR